MQIIPQSMPLTATEQGHTIVTSQADIPPRPQSLPSGPTGSTIKRDKYPTTSATQRRTQPQPSTPTATPDSHSHSTTQQTTTPAPTTRCFSSPQQQQQQERGTNSRHCMYTLLYSPILTL
ncbi:hypothetical protein Pelo_3619 [Pelomyxa schiedti]|nr:hypothetical protein Pelo_3619 [Pelomyxa schiedti]